MADDDGIERTGGFLAWCCDHLEMILYVGVPLVLMAVAILVVSTK